MFQSNQKISFSLLKTSKKTVTSLFLVSTSLLCMAENPTSSTSQAVKTKVQLKTDSRPSWKMGKKKALKPQYESCKDVDISSVALEEESKKKDRGGVLFYLFL